MVGRHKGLAQYGDTWMQCQLRRESAQQLNIAFTCECGTPAGRYALQEFFDKWQRDQEFGEFLDLARWEDDGGMIYDKA